MSMSAMKNRHRRIKMRLQNKRERAAARQALGGGRSKVARCEAWNHRPRQPVVVD